MPAAATPVPVPTSPVAPWVAAAQPYPKARLALIAAIVFLVANALPLVFLPASFNDTCDVDDGTDCWGAGMAILFLMALAPFAVYGFTVATVVLARLSAGRRLAMPNGSWSVLKVGAWLVGAPVAGIILAIPAVFLGELVPAMEPILAPLALFVMAGPYVAFAGWWMLVVLLSRLAFMRARPRVA